ncbi:MAG: hypothetical protein K0S47_587 [Herbinix sp.]|nr:hypothetical protein [Herbinix sp.]
MDLIKENCVQGIFLYETKHRFMCNVMIDGKKELCHVASSAKLEKIINLKGKRVLLTKNHQAGLRTKYTLLALLDRPKSLLNLSYANDLVYKELIKSKRGIILKEKYCDSYKTDFVIDNKCIIEVKTVLSNRSQTDYPSTSAERGQNQLIAIKKLLETGYKVELWIIYLNSRLKNVNVTEKSNYRELLNECVAVGLKIVEKRVIFKNDLDIKLQRLNKSIFHF